MMWICPKCETNNEDDVCIICGLAKPADESPVSDDSESILLSHEQNQQLLLKIHTGKAAVLFCSLFMLLLMNVKENAQSLTIFDRIYPVMSGRSALNDVQDLAASFFLLAVLIVMICSFFEYDIGARGIPTICAAIGFVYITVYCVVSMIELQMLGLPLEMICWLSPIIMFIILLCCINIMKWYRQKDDIRIVRRTAPESVIDINAKTETEQPKSGLKSTMRKRGE